MNAAPTGPVGGTVTAFDSKRGLGEIRGEDGRAYPFHCTKIADGTREIPVGVAVEFTVAPGPLGRWEAVAIRRRPTSRSAAQLDERHP